MYRAFGLLQPSSEFTVDEAHTRLTAKFPGFNIARRGDQITISKKNEAVMVSYKPGSSFQPKDLRDALGKTDATITSMQISARGRVQEQAGKQFFIAGKDKFILVSAPNSPQVPKDTPVLIEAVVNDRATPMELKVMTVKALGQ